MTDTLEELQHIAQDLERLVAQSRHEEIQQPLGRLSEAVVQIHKVRSRSWLGYQANVYTDDLQPPSNRAPFDSRKGLIPFAGISLYGGWREYSSQEIEETIFKLAHDPDMEPAFTLNSEASIKFQAHKFTLLSILDLEIRKSTSLLLSDLKEKVDELSLKTDSDFVESWKPENRIITEDVRAITQGIQTPPHLSIGAKVEATKHTLRTVTGLEELTRQIISHLSRQRSHRQMEQITGERVFIGHGRSLVWWVLKDFLNNDLGLPVEEFNRISTAGVSIPDRLSEMLDSVTIAFLVMTGEDEQPSGELRARENVVHEAGLFQGRLGFKPCNRPLGRWLRQVQQQRWACTH